MNQKPSPPDGGTRDGYLAVLGERVRTLRARRGMSRKVLAQQSDVSERHLAQLEGGTGNWSIILLRRIAQALSVPIGELVDDRPERPIEGQLLVEFLARLPVSELTEARTLLHKHFGGELVAGREARIALVGMRGAGKSTVGQMLAAKLDWSFIELDRAIELHAGMTSAEIFEMFGQATFRRMERQALERAVADNPRVVLATGGGLVTNAGTYETLLSSCITVWLRAAPQEHMTRVVAQGDFRPMAGNTDAMQDLISILSSREVLYAKADLVFDTSGRTPEESAQGLWQELDEKGILFPSKTSLRPKHAS